MSLLRTSLSLRVSLRATAVASLAASLGATTIALIGACLLWVLNQKMTWARATVAGMIAWLALVFYFGMVPSEWLNYAQTDLDWSSQRVAVTIPPALVLGNNVELSWAALKDSISMGYAIWCQVLGCLGTYDFEKGEYVGMLAERWEVAARDMGVPGMAVTVVLDGQGLVQLRRAGIAVAFSLAVISTRWQFLR